MIAPAAALIVAGGILVQEWSPEHPAFDYACRTGQPVYAIQDGTIRSSRSWSMGVQVFLEGENGTAYYAHLHRAMPDGEVKKGDVIGACGNTGAWSYGSHVHYEMRD